MRRITVVDNEGVKNQGVESLMRPGFFHENSPQHAIIFFTTALSVKWQHNFVVNYFGAKFKTGVCEKFQNKHF